MENKEHGLHACFMPSCERGIVMFTFMLIKSDVLMVMNVRTTAMWDVTPCSVVGSSVTVMWDVTPCIMVDRYQHLKHSAASLSRIALEVAHKMFL
jgi:hypothetical protein